MIYDGRIQTAAAAAPARLGGRRGRTVSPTAALETDHLPPARAANRPTTARRTARRLLTN